MDLYVGNLPFQLTNEELKSAFDSYGEVTSAKVILDRDSGRSKGFGFVTFANREDGERALEAMNGAELMGRPLKLNEAVPLDNKRNNNFSGPRGDRGGFSPREGGPRRGGPGGGGRFNRGGDDRGGYRNDDRGGYRNDDRGGYRNDRGAPSRGPRPQGGGFRDSRGGGGDDRRPARPYRPERAGYQDNNNAAPSRERRVLRAPRLSEEEEA